MKKNGFTFIEILGVITILAILSIIVLMVVDKNLKDSKNTLTDVQISNIKSAASMWRVDNIDLIPEDGYYVVTLGQLIDRGYVDSDIVNPNDNSVYDRNIMLNVYLNDVSINDQYKGLQYIESTGTQYINTGVSYDENNEYIIDCDVALTLQSVSSYSGWDGGGIFGNSENLWRDGSLSLSSIVYDGSISDKTNILLKIEKGLSSDTVMTVTQGNNTGTLTRTHPNIKNYTKIDYPIFAYSSTNNTLNGYINMRLWYMKISIDGKIVRDFIPCYRISDEVPGLYDAVNNQFYINNGTGEFIKGY